MSRGCWWALILILFYCPLGVRAEGEVGMLRVVVKYEDGTPAPKTPLVLKIGTEEIKDITGKDGVYARIVPVGKIEVLTPGAKKEVTIVAGEQNVVELVLNKRTGMAPPGDNARGVRLTVTFPDRAPAPVEVIAAYKAPGGDKQHLTGTPFGKNGFWFPEVPKDVTAFAVIALVDDGRVASTTRARWVFDTVDASRTLVMTVPRPTVLRVTIVDANGKPLPNTPVSATLSYPRTATQAYEYWTDTPPVPMNLPPVTVTLEKLMTDVNGRVELGSWPTRKYLLTISVNGKASQPVPFELKDERLLTMEIQYTLTARQ